MAVKNAELRKEVMDGLHDFSFYPSGSHYSLDKLVRRSMPCYGGTYGDYRNTARDCEQFVIYFATKWHDPDMLEKYVIPMADWFINSLFDEEFFTKDVKEGVEYGFEMNKDCPFINVLAAAIGLRTIMNRGSQHVISLAMEEGLTFYQTLMLLDCVVLYEGTKESSVHRIYYNSVGDHSMFTRPFFNKKEKIERIAGLSMNQEIDKDEFEEGVYDIYTAGEHGSSHFRNWLCERFDVPYNALSAGIHSALREVIQKFKKEVV